MFTGLIREVGTITAMQFGGETASIQIHAPHLVQDAERGDSICVNGACLTVSQLDGDTFSADISSETLQRTSFADTQPGARVNLEPALRLSDKLGGHMVAGHVDGVGTVEVLEGDGEFWRLHFRYPAHLGRYIAEKGSICLEGISLTIASVEKEIAGVAVIPETIKQTTLSEKNPGDKINIEVDLIARYIERLLSHKQADASNPGLTIEKLSDFGYPLDTG